MSRFQSLSAWFRRLSARERRIVAAGALVSTLAMLAVWVLLPLARRWQDREATIVAQEIRLGRLRSLVAGEDAATQILASRQRTRSAIRQRFLTGSTPALAASNLQARLQALADTSRVDLDRVDPMSEPGAAEHHGLPAIPVRLSGKGDIHGLTAFLNDLQRGEKLLVVDELAVNAGDATGQRPDLLVFSVRLHGVYGRE
jgi:type II secretory pathway component PulM